MAPMNEDAVIDGIFLREGDAYEDDLRKIDQPTGRGGITLAVLQEMSPQATLADLKALTHSDAREIIRRKVRQLAGQSGLNKIGFEPLRIQLLDFAYNSGTERAIRWLQRVLPVERTGKMDTATTDALARSNPFHVHHALAFARLLMLDQWSDPDARRAKDVNAQRKADEEGLENRTLSFSLLPIP
jgi:lysozyme family protein